MDNWIRDKKGEKKKGGKEKDKDIMDISLFLSTMGSCFIKRFTKIVSVSLVEQKEKKLHH